MDRAPFAMVGGFLVCGDCGRAGEVADARALVAHRASCPLGAALLDLERANKPVMLHDGEQAVRIFTATEGSVS